MNERTDGWTQNNKQHKWTTTTNQQIESVTWTMAAIYKQGGVVME